LVGDFEEIQRLQAGIRTWLLRTARSGLLAAACAIAGQSLTLKQWADYAGTQPFQQVCPAS
jgi:hypothetical protein